MQLAALFLAGLALFFTGVNGVKTKLQQMSSRKFRQILASATDRPLVAGFIGVGFGAVTQSASAVAFILSGMVATGLITLRRALPVVAASNVGTALLVFLAAIDMQLAVLTVIGITGIMINFKIASRQEALLGALFSIGVLFLGLSMMKQAFAPLSGYEWFQALAGFLRNWSWAPFILGAGLRMVIQSSSAIGVIAIALQAGGIFTEFQAVMLICGCGPGVAMSGLFLSGTLEGPPRQIVLYQGIINLVSGTVFAVLFFISELFGHKLLFLFMDAMASGNRIAWAFFLNMSGCLIAGLVIAPFIGPFLQRLAPPTQEQNLSRPAFIHDEALDVPENAVQLADKELQRLYSIVLGMLNTVREETKGGSDDEKSLHTAGAALGKEIDSFLEELVHRDIGGGVGGSILSLERRLENLTGLLETMHEFVKTQRGGKLTEKLKALMDRLSESLHLILMTAQDAWTSREEVDLIYLLKLSEDRGDMMERLRKAYQSVEGEGSLDQSSALFYATSLFERMVWLLRQLGLSLRQDRE